MMGGRCEGGTGFNLVPEEIFFTVDRRINPEEDLATEKKRLLELLEGHRRQGLNLEVEILQEGFSSGVPEDHPLARTLKRNVEEVTGTSPAFEMCPGLLEIRFYAQAGVPAFAFGPGLLEVSHGPKEFVEVDRIMDSATIYALTALDFLAD
jgi:acetylornithine deacetylase/succinyl-diaminopimelate desuccinylase-like protein